jgi:hypothetical protein
MFSWVAMERIYEREVLPDAKLSKEAGTRPLRAHAKHLTDRELLAKLCSFGIEIDRAWLERECERALSAQEIAGPLMDQSRSHGLEKRLDLDLRVDPVAALVSRATFLRGTG